MTSLSDNNRIIMLRMAGTPICSIARITGHSVPLVVKVLKNERPELLKEVRLEGRYDEQAVREQKYPSDRICFWSSESKADNDRDTFQRYVADQISEEEACERVARNNYLEMVTPAQLRNELKLLGYFR